VNSSVRIAFAGALVLLGPTAASAQRGGATAADTNIVAAISPPKTPLPPESATAGITKFSFIAYGDTRGPFDGTYLHYPHLLNVRSMIGNIRARAGSADPIKFVVQSGDAVTDGRRPGMLNVSYVPIIDQLTQQGDVPYFLAVGNHDVFSSQSLTDSSRVKGLRNYMMANAKLIPPEGSPRRLTGYPTYAFGYGNTFVILYDSQIAGDSVQFEWIRKQLEGLNRRRYVNVVAVCHHPTFSSGPHGGINVEASTQIIRDRFMPLFRKHHVKLLLTGHEHLFEHWVERYTDSTGTHRLDQIVSGGGGAPLYTYQGEPDTRAYLAAGASAKVQLQHLVKPAMDASGNPWHYLIVHVDGARLTIEVVGIDWGATFNPYRTAALVIEP
jgi:hypothetical protein